MKALAVVVAIAFYVLVLPGQAVAKEITAITVCGASGCRTVHHPPREAASGGDGVPDPAPGLRPYYTVTVTAGEQGNLERWRIFYIPKPAFLGLPGEDGRAVFERLDGGALPLLRAAARGVEPFPAPDITRVTVDGEAVTDPASYATLLTIDGMESSIPAPGDFVPIVFHASRTSPWTDRRYLMFSPSSGTLERGIRLIELPAGLAGAIVKGASLNTVGEPGRGSGRHGRVAIVALFGAALVCFAVWAAARWVRSARALPD